MWPLIRHMPISKEDLVLSVMEELIMPHWRTIMSPLWGADVTHKSACEWQAESLGESTWGWGYCHLRTRYWQHWWHPCYHYNMPNHSFSRNDCRNWSVLQQSGFLSSAFLFNIPPGFRIHGDRPLLIHLLGVAIAIWCRWPFDRGSKILCPSFVITPIVRCRQQKTRRCKGEDRESRESWGYGCLHNDRIW